MIISQNTKISILISENKKVIEALASQNKNFKKLKNPFLRKLFAPRVSVKDAAKIGGSSVNELLQKLTEIGFDVEFPKKSEVKKSINNKNISIIMKNNTIISLDVRPILEKGVDPYHAIMDNLKVLADDETLLIINSFEPVPLLNKLKTMQ